MQKLLKLFFVALFATLSLSLVSCSDDDDDNNVNSIVGTWVYAYDDGYHYEGYCKFKSNSTFELNETEVGDGFTDTSIVFGVYSLSGNLAEKAVLIMTPTSVDPDDAEIVTAIVRRAGDILYLSADGVTVAMKKK